MPIGIKDKVAILGMGCCRFGERWDASPEDLMVEAYNEAMADAGISPEQLDAAWFSTHMEDVGTGRGGTPLSIALRLPNIGVTRVENFCAGGSEAIRAAVAGKDDHVFDFKNIHSAKLILTDKLIAETAPLSPEGADTITEEEG